MIINLLNCNPEFKKIYEEVYTICLNMERMMSMFSKELEILDRNTVKLMVDEMIEEYTKMTEEHARKMEALDEVGRQMEAKQEKLKADEEKLKARKEKLETDVAIQKERAETAEAEVEYLRKQLAELQKSNK